MSEVAIVCDSHRHPRKVAIVAQYRTTDDLAGSVVSWRLAGGGWKSKQIRSRGRDNVADPERHPRCKLCGSRLNEAHPQLGAALTSLAAQGVSRTSMSDLIALESLLGSSGSNPTQAKGSPGE